MKCLKCGFKNPKQARFCAGCGVVVAAIECPHCQSGNEPGSRFCNSCGQSMADIAGDQPKRTPQVERRMLTVLFCDLVDSTQMVDSMDPELSRNLIREYQHIAKGVIENFGGRITEYLGDGIVAQFTRFETNAERAINAALQIIQSLAEADIRLGDSEQKALVRCGIATGLAVVGDMLGDDEIRSESAVGLPLNLAARIQSLAAENQVVIGKMTHQLARGLFKYEDLGQHALKGIKEPQQVWRVVAKQSISSRFVAHAAELTPMVNRTEISAKLMASWEACKKGEAKAILFWGEAGIGKSRIIQELKNKIAKECVHVEYQCSAYHTNTAFYPFISGLEAAAKITHVDNNAVRLRKLSRMVRWSSNDFEHDMPALVNVLSLSAEEKWPTPNFDPDEIREWVCKAAVNNLRSLSSKKPLLIQIEDVHWVDPSTLELINRLVVELKEHPVLLLITARPEFSGDLIAHPKMSKLEVEKLPNQYRKELVERLKGKSKQLDTVIDEIVERTEGIPLYIEELSKSLLERANSGDSGAESKLLANKDIPATLHDSLLSRLDNLPDESRSIAMLASVIGREFSFDLLERIANLESKNLYQVLSPLLEAQLILQQKAPPHAKFSFKHVMVRDVAYETLLQSDRAGIHKRIAEAIEAYFPERAKKSPELVARHFTDGKSYDKAVQYWLAAGKKASQSSANIEARSHLEAALSLLEDASETDKNAKLELQSLIYLGSILKLTEGPAAKSTRDTYDKIVALCEKSPESSLHFSGLWGIWHNSLNFKQDHGLVWTNRLQRLADQLEGEEYKLQACHAKWTTLFHLGRFAEAYKQMQDGIQFYDRRRDYLQASKYGGHDPYVCLNGFGSHALWLMGDIEQSLEKAQNCADAATELNHTGSILQSIEANLLIHQFRKDPPMILVWVRKLDDFLSDSELPAFHGMSLLHRGWAVAYQGECDRGLKMMEEGMAIRAQRSNKEDAPLYSDMFAEILSIMGRLEEALEYVKKAISVSREGGYLYWLAELVRREGEIHAKQGSEQTAEKCFLESLEISKEQESRLLSLRAAVSLATLKLKGKNTNEALQILEPVYLSFSDCLDSLELEGAKKLYTKLTT